MTAITNYELKKKKIDQDIIKICLCTKFNQNWTIHLGCRLENSLQTDRNHYKNHNFDSGDCKIYMSMKT